jgi:hypothetical protein
LNVDFSSAEFLQTPDLVVAVWGSSRFQVLRYPSPFPGLFVDFSDSASHRQVENENPQKTWAIELRFSLLFRQGGRPRAHPSDG